uniref:ATP synthase complex subunit 8 n=1 Tax=Nemichthys scolopaceus TaxID=118170 RepID=D1YTT5_9TELE|nr:ATP synthase F0 subunit 8 [Nemichthys scolopaceus]BAI53319.1 ATPase subunit 8 [Nemichthys scolopaceus]
MPQLDPAPWFMILMFSWTVFLTILPTKIMAYVYNNEPSHQSAEKPKLTPWNWPWY